MRSLLFDILFFALTGNQTRIFDRNSDICVKKFADNYRKKLKFTYYNFILCHCGVFTLVYLPELPKFSIVKLADATCNIFANI